MRQFIRNRRQSSCLPRAVNERKLRPPSLRAEYHCGRNTLRPNYWASHYNVNKNLLHHKSFLDNADSIEVPDFWLLYCFIAVIVCINEKLITKLI